MDIASRINLISISINSTFDYMDLTSIGNYYIWAEEKIQSKLEEINDEDFYNKHEGLGRSLRELAEHLYVSYESYFHKPTAETWKTLSNKAAAMNRKELMENWISATKKFAKVMAESDKDEFKLPLSKEKTLQLEKDNYFFLYTDHQTYHRGQMMSLIKILGKEGIGTDYYNFLAKE